jgi:hypothetical protein
MPRGDGTGPAGMGPMTGRAAGYCAGYTVPGFMNPYGGRFAASAPFPYPARPGTGMFPYPSARYGWGGYPAYGPAGFRGRPFGYGFGRGRGGGRGRW